MKTPNNSMYLPRVDGNYEYDNRGIARLSNAIYVFDIYKYELMNLDKLLSHDYKTVISLLHGICYSYSEEQYGIVSIKQYFMDKYSYDLKIAKRFDRLDSIEYLLNTELGYLKPKHVFFSVDCELTYEEKRDEANDHNNHMKKYHRTKLIELAIDVIDAEYEYLHISAPRVSDKMTEGLVVDHKLDNAVLKALGSRKTMNSYIREISGKHLDALNEYKPIKKIGHHNLLIEYLKSDERLSQKKLRSKYGITARVASSFNELKDLITRTLSINNRLNK